MPASIAGKVPRLFDAGTLVFGRSLFSAAGRMFACYLTLPGWIDEGDG